jgi:hypothetical protein
MLFHVRLTDFEPSRRHAGLRDAHWRYFESHADHFIARGATFDDDGNIFKASVIFVDFPDRGAVEAFVANEPLNQAGVFESVEIVRWSNPLGRRQRDFARTDGQVCWYIRGWGKAGVNDRRNELFAAHQAYFKPYDGDHFIVRGGALSADGTVWTGSANLIALPDRASVEAFVADEPFYKNGLFERVVIERYNFGGRPGQIT